MSLKHAATRNSVVPPPKSRVGAKVAPLLAKARRAHTPITPVAEAANAELEVVRGMLDRLMLGRYELVIFMTGNSVFSLFALAQELGRLRDLVQVLQTVITACRSPKAAAVLRRFKVQPRLGEPGLHTTRRLSHWFRRLDLAGRTVLRLNGTPGDLIANRLRDQRARVREVSLAHRRPPIKASMSELFKLASRGTSRDHFR